MLSKLPELVDPVVFAERQSHVVATLDIKRLKRLSELLDSTEGHLDVDWQFYKEARVPKIEGHIRGHLSLICQNCLGPVEWPLDKLVKIGMVQSLEQADQFEEDLEPLLVSGEKMSLPDIIEDEVLMSLPDYPRHKQDCSRYKIPESLVESEDTEQKPAANPFAVLAQLKNSGDQ